MSRDCCLVARLLAHPAETRLAYQSETVGQHITPIKVSAQIPDQANREDQVQKESGYAWRKAGEYRWLCVAEDETATIVGGIVKEGFRRYRIQLPGREGTLCSGPVVFERFKIAEFLLKAKLRIGAIRREHSALAAYAN
jgi:hypothetical protein